MINLIAFPIDEINFLTYARDVLNNQLHNKSTHLRLAFSLDKRIIGRDNPSKRAGALICVALHARKHCKNIFQPKNVSVYQRDSGL